ncbi:MAG: FKBP-type peptidyl-prolyl cis-trans isomerase [Bacteroidales bacterium]
MNYLRHILYFVLFFVSTLFISCSQNGHKNQLTQKNIQKRIKEQSIEVNKHMTRKIQDSIETYVAKNNIEMQRTPTGMWYNIKRSGNTDSIVPGDIIQYEYTVSLLNGNVCYSSDSTGLKNVKVGQAGVESGLEEAFLRMHKGDTAHLIIPPHLAHGFSGDGNNIPRMAILDYTLTILRHKKN